MGILEINNLTHIYGEKILYKNASFRLNKNEHMGVVGQNGVGKSTLISILAGEIIPDEGNIKWQKNINIGYLNQHLIINKNCTISEYLKSTFNELYKMEKDIQNLYDKYSKTSNEKFLSKVYNNQIELESKNFYYINTLLNKIVNGLGISAIGIEKNIAQLSGGQRTKIILAKLLLETPDILLLDEPTNFLDKEHIDWLIEYLNNFKNAFIVVSHDFEFLNKISDCICDIEAYAIKKYHGKYSDFLIQKQHIRQEHIKQYNAQQRMIKRTEEFIRKDIAGVNSKNAKGRRRQLENLERIAFPSFILKPNFRFLEEEINIQKPLIVNNLEIGYNYPFLSKFNFVVSKNEKIIITGFNGIGKSTLLKTLVGQIKSLSGNFIFSEKVKIGYYEQDLYWKNKNLNPIQIILEKFPNLPEKQIRKYLSKCGSDILPHLR